MLTKTDLKAIGQIVDKKLDVKFDTKLKPLHGDIKIIKHDVKKLQEDLKMTSNFLDVENLKATKRINKIEPHLGIPEPGIV